MERPKSPKVLGAAMIEHPKVLVLSNRKRKNSNERTYRLNFEGPSQRCKTSGIN